MDKPHPQAPGAERTSRLGALASRAFVVVWTAHALGLVGISMNDTASGWLMTTLDLNPLDVSLVHAATTLPMFLVTLPAGALADIVDPRRLILATTCAIVALMSAFAALVSLDLATPLSLLLTTFLLSAAWSVNAPAWLAMLPSLVSRSDLAGALAANGVAYNFSRTVGPALGGMAIAYYGLASPYWAFAGANLVVIASLIWWRPQPREPAALPAERLTGAVRTGLRHAANNPLFRATLVRTVAVYPPAAAYGALLPLIARDAGQTAEHYGLMVSTISAGALVGSFAQQFLRKAVGLDWTVALGSIGAAAALAIFASSHAFAFLLAACLCVGVSWILVLTSLMVSAQNVLPRWVRGRGLSIFLTVIFGSVATGSAVWGEAAARFGLEPALFAAAAGVLLCIPLSWSWKLQNAENLDLTPSLHYRRPQTAETIADRRGPVLVKIEYWIDPKDRTRFLTAIDELGEQRRRDGAFAWGVYEDMDAFGRFEEGYLIESWLELMHFRERITNEDLALEDEIRAMLNKPPHIEYLVAAERRALNRATIGA